MADASSSAALGAGSSIAWWRCFAAWETSVVSQTTSPSRSTILRFALRATFRSWVTRMMVMPLVSLRWRNIDMMSRLVLESRFPVGSSPSRMEGRLTRARAMATRCCWPPESWLGWWSSRSPRPTICSISTARARRSVCASPWEYIRGSSTFSTAVVRASRLKFWNTNPIRWLRMRARWSRDMVAISSPASR